MKNIVKERNEAFLDVLEKDDFRKLAVYCRKYGVPIPPNKKVAKAGVMKAIQQCDDFTEEQKAKAMTQCFELGFNPF